MNAALILFGLATTPLELISFVLAVITVWLNIRQNHWAWLFAIISSASYAGVFFDAKLYGDTGLQLVFIAVSIWGWRQWLKVGSVDDVARSTPPDSTPGHTFTLQVSRLGARGWWLVLAGWLAGYLVLSWFLRRYTDTDVPHIDGFLTAGSLLGQWLLARKKLENWHVWIFVDVLYVGLYLYKHLMLTAILYGFFVLMALAGLRVWRRAMAKDMAADKCKALA
jgi:nicotinamide mononucleotide transporter